MLELIDEYCWDKNSQLITADRHKVPGLCNFAHWCINKSTLPTPFHIHSNIIEFHCMVKGKRFCEVNGERFTITGNELLVTFPNEVHSTSTDAQTPNEFYGFQLDIRDKTHLLGMDPEYSAYLCSLLLALEHRRLRVTPDYMDLLKHAFELFAAMEKRTIHEGVQYICSFLFSVPTFLPAEHVTEEDPHMNKVLEYIEENACGDISLNELAEIACLSLSRFKYKFKSVVGHTPAEYITLKKIERARKLLVDTEYSITEIAFQLGFSTSNYFCEVFKRVANCSPSQYRLESLRRRLATDF